MRKITVSIDDETLAAVRRYAAGRGVSVNALVREFLANLVNREDRAGQARARLRRMSDRSPGRPGATTWTRNDLHDR